MGNDEAFYLNFGLSAVVGAVIHARPTLFMDHPVAALGLSFITSQVAGLTIALRSQDHPLPYILGGFFTWLGGVALGYREANKPYSSGDEDRKRYFERELFRTARMGPRTLKGTVEEYRAFLREAASKRPAHEERILSEGEQLLSTVYKFRSTIDTLFLMCAQRDFRTRFEVRNPLSIQPFGLVYCVTPKKYSILTYHERGKDMRVGPDQLITRADHVPVASLNDTGTSSSKALEDIALEISRHDEQVVIVGGAYGGALEEMERFGLSQLASAKARS